MMKKFIIALATIGLLGALPSCTSKDSKNEDVIAEDGTADDLALGSENLDESLDGEQVTGSDTPPVAETATEDQLTMDSFGTEGTDSAATAPSETAPDANAQLTEPMPPMTTEPPANDLAMEQPTTGAEEIAPPMEKIDEQASAPTEQTDLDQPKPVRSLQKMAGEPWKVGSKWVNGIYFARPGDSLDSISQTIYGDDRTSELKKINPTYKARDVKPGDKVYFASAVRPDDNTQVKTFFEERNMMPKTYISKDGDNIRKVSQDLLGYPEAWKEVWSYNSVESKQDLGEGVELRYWDGQPSMGSQPAPIAEAPIPQPNDQMAQMPPMQELPPPPDMNNQNMANNDLPPPPPPMDTPPPMEMAPPPPPPPPPPQAMAQTEEISTTSEQDTTLAMGAVAVAVLGAVALIIVRRKRRQKEMDQALGETHVG